jgi:hypothetical protein
MRARARKRNAGAAPRGFGKANDTANDTPLPLVAQRSAANWFLDAACYATDGDVRNARLAAARAISAMRHGR